MLSIKADPQDKLETRGSGTQKYWRMLLKNVQVITYKFQLRMLQKQKCLLRRKIYTF